MVEMVSDEQIANLHVLLLPLLQLLVESRDLRREHFVLGEGGEAVDLHFVEIELGVKVLGPVSESDGLGLEWRGHLVGLEVVVGLRLVALLLVGLHAVYK